MKNNQQAWPFGPSDGGDDNNYSWAQSGDTALQQRAARTGLALTLLAAGVPMFSGGDELYRTQYGNNNPYNLDSANNWLPWSNLTSQAAFFDFTRQLCHFRAAHPALRPSAYLDGQDHDGNGLKNLSWLNAAGLELDDAARRDPAQHFLAFRLDGSEAGESVTSLCVAYNASESAVLFTLPSKKAWLAVGDSAAGLFRGPGQEAAIGGTSYSVAPRSVAVLLEQ